MTADSSPRVGNVPAAAVIAACLRAQASVPGRSGFARVVGRSPLSSDSRPWYLGALGELRVAERLAKLGPEWTVLHSVPIGDRGSDIDHMVVGPAGVFTINTKFHEDARIWVGSSRLLVNGQKTDHLRNSRYEAKRIAGSLIAATGIPIEVHAVIVLVDARSITVRERPADVAVLRDTELLSWLKRRPTNLDADGLGRIVEAIRPVVDNAVAPRRADADVDAFKALRQEVSAARRVRVLWGIAGMVSVLAVAGTLALNAYQALLGGLGGISGS